MSKTLAIQINWQFAGGAGIMLVEHTADCFGLQLNADMSEVVLQAPLLSSGQLPSCQHHHRRCCQKNSTGRIEAQVTWRDHRFQPAVRLSRVTSALMLCATCTVYWQATSPRQSRAASSLPGWTTAMRCWVAHWVQTTATPTYLSELEQTHLPPRALCSSNAPTLVVSCIHTKLHCRTFYVAAPSTWNSLPADIRLCENILTFKRHLKTLNAHISLLFSNLSIFKVNECIEYKLLSLTYKVIITSQSSYHNNPISVQPPRSTRSSSVVTLSRLPTISSLKVTDRSFRYASTHLWNQLPDSFRQPRQSCLDSPPHSLVISIIITTVIIHHSFTPSSKPTFSTNPSHLRLLLPTGLPSWQRVWTGPIMLILLFLVSHFNFLFVCWHLPSHQH